MSRNEFEKITKLIEQFLKYLKDENSEYGRIFTVYLKILHLPYKFKKILKQAYAFVEISLCSQ